MNSLGGCRSFVAIFCLALISMSACGSTSEVTCLTQRLNDAGSVGLRMTSHDTVEVVSPSDDGILILTDVFFGKSPKGFALGLNENEAMYAWIWGDEPDMSPTWYSASSREAIEATRCRFGREAVTVVVTNDDAILMEGSGEILFDQPPAKTLTLIGQVAALGARSSAAPHTRSAAFRMSDLQSDRVCQDFGSRSEQEGGAPEPNRSATRCLESATEHVGTTDG